MGVDIYGKIFTSSVIITRPSGWTFPDTAAFILLRRLVLSDHALFLRNFLAISLIYPSPSISALDNFLNNFVYISRNVRLMQD